LIGIAHTILLFNFFNTIDVTPAFWHGQQEISHWGK